VVICGREVSPEIVQQLRAEGAGLSQRQRSRRLCEISNWVGPSGRLQVSVGRQVVARLEQTGALTKSASSPLGLPRWVAEPKSSPLTPIAPIACCLEELGPIQLVLVGSRTSQRYGIWKGLLETYHYLGAGPLCGAQLRYLIQCPRGWIGAMAFSAAALRLESRDRWIGWSQVARRENLHRVVNNSRFLIPEPVQVPGLASHVLSLAAGQIQGDWRERYGYEPVLLESFVDLARGQGGCYRAANWQGIGISAGRGRQDRQHQAQVGRKVVWVYPLQKDFRCHLCAEPEQRRLSHPPPKPQPQPAPPQDWAEEELAGALLPNQRLHRRATILLRDFFARPQSNIPQACGSRAKAKAAYRFFDHEQVSMTNVLQGHYETSMRRAGVESVVLAVQDTTELNYSTHRATEQLGPIGEKKTKQVGMLVHDTMLYNGEGTPLGLLDVQCWVRDEEELELSPEQRRQRPIEQKESYKWLQSFQAASRLQERSPKTQVISVGDRESDLYELFLRAQQDPHGTKLLVRACQDRRLADGEQGLLWERILAQPVVAGMELKVPPNRKKQQPARTARVEVRYGAVELAAPLRKSHLGSVKLWAVSVLEAEPPAGVEAVEWMLLTNVRVESPEGALQSIDWYRLRFQIEVYHRTLKSGCKIEERQLGSAERIESCLGLDMIVAWRVTYLTKLGRETPEVPCTVFFEDAQWQAVLFYFTKVPPPAQPPSLRFIQLLVAQLGGFLGRKGDGHPGTKSMWLGLQRMDDMTEMWRGMKSLDRTALLSLMDSS
jgi:hypothetical protein